MTLNIDPLLLDIAFLFCALGILLRVYQRYRQTLPLPPGPRPWPLIGNISDFPTHHEGRFYLKHKELYGQDLLHIILSYYAVVDIFYFNHFQDP